METKETVHGADARDVLILILMIVLVAISCPSSSDEYAGNSVYHVKYNTSDKIQYDIPDLYTEGNDVTLPDEQYDRYYR